MTDLQDASRTGSDGLFRPSGSGYDDQMKKASISELKNQLSAYLQRVRAGQTVVVYDRGRPIARIDRIADEDDDDLIAQLQRAGIVTPPREPLPLEMLRAPLPHAEHGVLDALLQDRAEGR